VARSLFLELNSLMVKYRFWPDKRKGQHFITSRETVQKLVDSAELTAKDTVLEIGPGSGFLTRELTKTSRVIAVEKDKVLCELMHQELGEKNLQLVCGDYLKEKIPKYNKVVSFPPYFISKKMMLKLFSEKPELCVLVFQSEFAEKLAAMPGFREYSALSVICQYFYETRIIGRVQSKKFFPKPESDSSIVLLKKRKRKTMACDEAGFIAFVREIFRHKNKSVSNALSNSQKFLVKINGEQKGNMRKKTREPVFGKMLSRALVFPKSTNAKLVKKKVSQLSVEELVGLYNSLYT